LIVASDLVHYEFDAFHPCRMGLEKHENRPMKEILNRFSVESVKINSQTISIAVLLYLVTLGCVLWSIQVQPFNKKERFSWMVIVILLGPFGILGYLPVAWRNAATGSLSFWRKPKRSRQ